MCNVNVTRACWITKKTVHTRTVIHANIKEWQPSKRCRIYGEARGQCIILITSRAPPAKAILHQTAVWLKSHPSLTTRKCCRLNHLTDFSGALTETLKIRYTNLKSVRNSYVTKIFVVGQVHADTVRRVFLLLAFCLSYFMARLRHSI